MAKSVKKLSTERQIHAKMKISKIVGQLELEEITHQSGASLSDDRQETSTPIPSRSTCPSETPPSSTAFAFLASLTSSFT